jgi:WXG100 family type VII secretion target
VTTTEAQAQVMAHTAARFDAVNASLETMLRKLMGELDVLRTQWQGAGGRSFDQVKTAWAHDQGMLHKALGETAEAIRQAAGGYDATDTHAAQRMSPANRNLINLPL